ncbi:MAG: hypothetical protein HY240_10095, partial [Actinobacteria bacterium]|nr:hypothetical protein [Actinomycetota bacterium]
MKVLLLVDGEHYPPVTRWAIEVARERGFEPVGALMVGGAEKVDRGSPPDLGLPVRQAGPDRMAVLREAISELSPEA